MVEGVVGVIAEAGFPRGGLGDVSAGGAGREARGAEVAGACVGGVDGVVDVEPGAAGVAQGLCSVVLVEDLVREVFELVEVGDEEGVFQRGDVTDVVVEDVDGAPGVLSDSLDFSCDGVLRRGVGAHHGKRNRPLKVLVELRGVVVEVVVVGEVLVVEVEDWELVVLDVLRHQPLVQLQLLHGERVRLADAGQNVHVVAQLPDDLNVDLLESVPGWRNEVEAHVDPPVLEPRVSSQPGFLNKNFVKLVLYVVLDDFERHVVVDRVAKTWGVDDVQTDFHPLVVLQLNVRLPQLQLPVGVRQLLRRVQTHRRRRVDNRLVAERVDERRPAASRLANHHDGEVQGFFQDLLFSQLLKKRAKTGQMPALQCLPSCVLV